MMFIFLGNKSSSRQSFHIEFQQRQIKEYMYFSILTFSTVYACCECSPPVFVVTLKKEKTYMQNIICCSKHISIFFNSLNWLPRIVSFNLPEKSFHLQVTPVNDAVNNRSRLINFKLNPLVHWTSGLQKTLACMYHWLVHNIHNLLSHVFNCSVGSEIHCSLADDCCRSDCLTVILLIWDDQTSETQNPYWPMTCLGSFWVWAQPMRESASL